MAGRIPDETLQAIRERVSLVEVVSAYVHLKRTGRDYVGLCPFHTEKTPSFNVSEERGLFHCYGCGVGGTAFTFVMRIEGLEFREAVEQLAQRAGVEIPAAGGGPGQAVRESLYAANEAAARFFRRELAARSGEAARHYLEQRGFSAETVERYGLGWAPPGGGALMRVLASEGVSREAAQRAGLLARSADGRTYDRFRARVMFPIRDQRGRVLAFGGRGLADEQPKYLNSPESPIFHKGAGLYGVAEARQTIREQRRAVLVEGYTDVLILAQEGLSCVVGVLGTSLSAAQLKMLRPLGGAEATLTFLFDGDDAGRRAAARAFGVCAEANVWGRAAFLPQGSDPDSYTREYGISALETLLKGAVPLADWYFDRIAPPGSPMPVRARAAQDVKALLARVRDTIRFDLLARQAAERLGVSEDVFRRGGRQVPARRPEEETPPREWPRAEALLLQAMVMDPRAARWVADQGVLKSFNSDELAALGAQVLHAVESGQSATVVLDAAPDGIREMLSEGLMGGGPMVEANHLKVARDCVRRIDARALRQRVRTMAAELRQAEDRGDVAESSERLERLNELLREDGRAG